MRFPLEVFEAIRQTWPRNKPLGIRISATAWIDGGWGIDDSIAYASELRALDCDYITVSSGGTLPEQKIEVQPGYQVSMAECVRREAGIATIAVGLITKARQAEEIVASGKADMVAIGREMLFNPRWPWHAALELGEQLNLPPQYERAHPAMCSGDFLRAKRE